MNQTRRIHPRPGILPALGLLFAPTLAVAAADGEFAGKWKGEMKAQTPSAPAAGAAPTGNAPTAGGGAGAGGGRGGGRGGAGGAGGFGGGPQKVTLNLKQSKDKVSGNITFGEGQAEDVKDGRISGNTITFKAGRALQIYEYLGELKGEELLLTRNSSDGRTRPQEIVLKKN